MADREEINERVRAALQDAISPLLERPIRAIVAYAMVQGGPDDLRIVSVTGFNEGDAQAYALIADKVHKIVNGQAVQTYYDKRTADAPKKI